MRSIRDCEDCVMEAGVPGFVRNEVREYEEYQGPELAKISFGTNVFATAPHTRDVNLSTLLTETDWYVSRQVIEYNEHTPANLATMTRDTHIKTHLTHTHLTQTHRDAHTHTHRQVEAVQ